MSAVWDGRVLGVVLFAAGVVGRAAAQVPLPGTQPFEGGVRIEAVSKCRMCHAGTANGPHDPLVSWQSGLMSMAARDPIFRAALAIANQDIPGVGDFCLRCHTPRGFLAGRTLPPDGSALEAADLESVSCAVCHRLVDPRTQEATRLVKEVPPGLGNGMMVFEPAYVMRGPYGDDPGVKMRPHQVKKSPFLASGDVCGTCHNVSNPLQATNVKTQPPQAYGHVERTYSEWKLSEYATQGSAGACQACHYPPVAGGGHPTRLGKNPKREHFVPHGAVGGSTWVQEAIWRLWEGTGLNRAALDLGQQKARDLLRTAATLELRFPAPGRARLRITNETGHKLPTGYPEGRRMWVQARCYNAAGELWHEIGRYGEKEETIRGEKIEMPTLLDPEQTRVYECLPAISAAQAKKYKKPAGPSFFFVLNDEIAKDNRIPPRGFQNSTFAEHHCEPVGATYQDGQYWDDFEFDVPEGTARVEARLMYESVSAEYVKFLAEEDQTDEWGRRVYEVWGATGYCPPEVIAEITRPVEVAGG